MEENNQNEQPIINTEELKKETAEVVNEVKETVNKADIQGKANDSIELVKTMFKDPFAAVKKVAEEKKHKYIWVAVILTAVWTLMGLIYALATLSSLRFGSFEAIMHSVQTIMSVVGRVIGALITPSLSIFALALIAWLFNKNSKKSLLGTVEGIAIIKTPVVAASIINLLSLIPGKVYPITNAFSTLCSVLSVVFSYFLIKGLYEEKEDNKFMIKFIIIYAIYYAAALILGYIGISL